MNLVGKILTGLIALFSIVFMSLVLMVYATHKNWRAQAEAVEKQRDQLQKDNTDLKTNLDKQKKQFDEDKAAADNARLAEQEWRKTLEQRNAEQQQTLDKADKQLTTALTTLDTTQKNATDLIAQVHGGKDKDGKDHKGLRTELKEEQQQHGAWLKRSLALQDQVQALQNVLATLKFRESGLLADAVKYRKILELNNMSLNPDAYVKVAPVGLKGRVTAVGANGLVEIDVGSDAGLRPGQHLQVYRASGFPYLGKLEVVEAKPQVAVCRVIPEYRKGPIQRDDHVAATN
jgi:hypothetical protein